MQKNAITADSLFQRVVSILEHARENVARQVVISVIFLPRLTEFAYNVTAR